MARMADNQCFSIDPFHECRPWLACIQLFQRSDLVHNQFRRFSPTPFAPPRFQAVGKAWFLHDDALRFMNHIRLCTQWEWVFSETAFPQQSDTFITKFVIVGYPDILADAMLIDDLAH